jgi:hypothetical protein
MILLYFLLKNKIDIRRNIKFLNRKMSKSILEANELDKITTRKDIKFTVKSSNTYGIIIKESSINNSINKIIKEEKKTTFNQRNLIQRNIVGKNKKYNKRCNRTRQGLKKGQWSIQEDKLLEQWIKENGPRKWNQCGRFIQGRSGKQCREHWNNCLNPELVKGEWTPEEDFLIMYFYEQCNGSWKKIIPLFNGRTENSIKNRFFSQLRKIATKDASIEKRKECSKIKLEELKKFLNEAISDAKKELFSDKNMNEEDINNYINKMKVKIQKKSLEENEISEVLSTNLGDLENIKNNAIENKEINFIGKKRATKNEEINYVLSSLDSESSNIEAKKYQKELTYIINNDRVNDINIFTDNLKLKTDFNNFDNGNNNFNYIETVYNNNNDNLNKYCISQDSSQLLNIFNHNNYLFDDLDCYNHQSENEEDFTLFPLDSKPYNLVDYPFKSKLSINSINDNNTIFNDLFEE